jgi:hypothetical protein
MLAVLRFSPRCGAPIFESCSPGNKRSTGNVQCSRSSMTGDKGVADKFLELAMKTIVSALIAVAVLAGVAAPASALDAKKMSSERQDRASQAPVGGPSSGEPLVW